MSFFCYDLSACFITSRTWFCIPDPPAFLGQEYMIKGRECRTCSIPCVRCMLRVTWLPAMRTWSSVLAPTTRGVCQEPSLRQFSSFYWRIPPKDASIARCLDAFARKSTRLDNDRKPRPQLLCLNEAFSLVKFEIPSVWLSAYMTTDPYSSSTLSSLCYILLLACNVEKSWEWPGMQG